MSLARKMKRKADREKNGRNTCPKCHAKLINKLGYGKVCEKCGWWKEVVCMTNERTEETLDVQQAREALKKRLWKYQALKREQEQLLQSLADIEATLYSPKIQKLTGMPAAPSDGDSLGDMAARHIELQQKYQAQLERLAAEQLAIEQTIAVLEEPTARMLMRYRYLDGLTWEEVCVKLTYSWRQTHRLHARALDELLGETA